jgi:hypothetical protein
MADEFVTHKITVGEDWKKPVDDGKPVFGTRRLVKLIPTPVGAYPCLWMSTTTHKGQHGKQCHHAIILIQKSPPQTMACEIDAGSSGQLPLVPIEW